VAQIMPIVALFQVFDGMSALTSGIMRARGQQSIGALLNLLGYYILGIPIGIWLAFNWGMGLEGLWIGLSLALIVVAGVGFWLALTADWEKEVRKVKARLEADMTPSDGGSVVSTHV
jgi:MATE family multidrug resistance protein